MKIKRYSFLVLALLVIQGIGPIHVANAARTNVDRCKLANANGQNVNLGLPRDPLLLPSTGTVKVLVVGVDFSNARESDIPEQMVTGFELATVKDFFATSSYGRLNLDFTIVSEVVSLPISDVGVNDSVISQETGKALPSTYKLNDYSALLIVTTKNSSYSSSTASAGSTVQNSTGRVTNYSVLAGIKPNESRWLSSPWRTVAHEVGHLLGLMDLWNREDSTAWQGQTAAPFSLMNTGAGWGYAGDFFAWEKWVLGWIPDTDVYCFSKDPNDLGVDLASLDALQGIRLVAMPITSTKVLAIEYRKKSTLDFGIVKSGALVYTVDTTKRNFELPIRIVSSEEALQQPFVENLKDYERYKRAPLGNFDSVEIEGLQVANTGIDSGKSLLISNKSRSEIKAYLGNLLLQAKAETEAKAAAELKAKQEAEVKAAVEIKAKQDSEAKAKQEAEAKAAAELKAKQEAAAKAAAGKASSLKKTTIICIKGKLIKKVSAVKPKCPKGYKLK
jgi:M6 family metalloprotease-like protein